MSFDRAIDPKKYFVLSNGRVLKNLNELLNALKTMDEGTFKSHVNQQKNDFGNWARDVFEENELAQAIFKSKSREGIIKSIETKIFKAGQKAKNIKSEKSNKKIPKNIQSAAKKTIKIDNLESKKNKIKKIGKKPSPAIGSASDVADGTQASSYGGAFIEKQQKIDEILMKEKDIEKREERIQEMGARIEEELTELTSTKENPEDRKAFSKEFLIGLVIGLVLALIIAVLFVRFFG